MKGSNELHLCTAEMMVAVQEYLDKRMAGYAPSVDTVRVEKDVGCLTFIVVLKEKEPPCPK
jgi:hypothetical protein